MERLQIPGIHQAVDANGLPVAQAKRYVFAAGRETLLPVYEDPELTQQLPQPMTADENGLFQNCYLVDGTYRILIETPKGDRLQEWDHVSVHSIKPNQYIQSFSNVRALLEDDTLSYSAQAGKTQVFAGQEVYVQNGRHSYVISDEADTEPSLKTQGHVILKPHGHAASAWGAIYDGVFDNSPVFQRMIDAGILTIRIDAAPNALVGMGSPVLIHGRSGLAISGDTNKVTLKALSDMAFDAARLEHLDLELKPEYSGQQAFFIITEYDGENDRPNYAARDYQFKNLRIDGSGDHTRDISFVASPHASHILFQNIFAKRLKHLYDGWLLSDHGSRHYHIAYRHIRLVECMSLASGEYLEGNAHIAPFSERVNPETSIGTSMNIHEVSFEASRQGLKIYGQNYSQIGPLSIDNNFSGSYAVDIFDSQCSIGSVGIENRLGRVGVQSGGGVLRIKDSDVQIAQLTTFSGDKDGNASPGSPISDYDDGSGTLDDSLIVIESSHVEIGILHASLIKDQSDPTTQWPIVVKGGAILKVRIGDYGEAGQFYNPDHFDVRDSSVVHIIGIDGRELWLRGPEAQDYSELKGAVATGADNSSCINNAGLNILTDLPPNILCRVNQGAVGATDPSDFNLPSAAYGGSYFGLALLEQAGHYKALTYKQTNGRIFCNHGANNWSGWRQISGVLPEVTSADLMDINHDINQAPEKLADARIWNTTIGCEMRASGNLDSSEWVPLHGGSSILPS
jgi:hypothetical protein